MKDFTWVIIYIVIMIVAFLVKQARRQNVRQSQANREPVKPSQPQAKATSPSSQSVSVKFEQYFTQLEKAFTNPPPLPQQSQRVETVSKLPYDEEELMSERTYRKRPVATRSVEKNVPDETSVSRSLSLLPFKERWNIVQGIVMAEVLGPPVSKRQGRGRRGRV